MSNTQSPVTVAPFTIGIDEAILGDLRERIRRTRWPAAAATAAGWDAGVDPSYLRSLLESWAEFDWREHERALNKLGHYRADIDGYNIHFIHERGRGPDPLPLVLTHGFPSSFLEYRRLLPLLTDPAAYGGSQDDAFDVVLASLPGYGFSDPLDEPFLEAAVARLWCRLMTEGLGYARFGAHGSDVGAGPTTQLGLNHAEHVAGIHLSAFYLAPPAKPWSPAVVDFLERQRRERAPDVAYSALQRTRPQTAAYGLADSPAGLAAWVVDLFRAFSDCGGDVESRFTRDHLLSNLTVYWATETIATAMRAYYDFDHFEPDLPEGTRVEVPTGFAVFADSFRPGSGRPPREMAEHAYNVARWSVMPRGGHYAALEEPELLAEELRAFFRPLRARV